MAESIIVTGATGYFGSYFVNHLAQHYQVIAIARDPSKLNVQDSKSIIFRCCDLSQSDQVKSVISDILDHYNVVGLVNNAHALGHSTGFNTMEGHLHLHTDSMIRMALEVGLIAPFIMAQALGNNTIKNGGRCSIVNISSMYASVAPDPELYRDKKYINPISYGMTKAALEYMTKYIASFWGSKGVRCNAIAPGPFPNIETTTQNSTRDEDFIGRLRNKTTVDSVGHPTDLLGALDLLLSEKARFINGEVIRVDGGWTAR